MKVETAKKVLVIEDEEMISEVIREYLVREGFLVEIVEDGGKAVDKFHEFQPHIVVLDLMLPGMSGERICQEIRKGSRTPIIMVTAKVEEEDVLKGLDIGADDYITKPFSVRQLVGKIKAVLRRSETDPLALFRYISFNENDLVIDTVANEVKKQGQIVKLTPNEYKLLLTLLKYPQKTFTREELIELSLGLEYEGYSRTIDTHIKNLRQKIEDDMKSPKYILTVHGFGYRFGGK